MASDQQIIEQQIIETAYQASQAPGYHGTPVFVWVIWILFLITPIVGAFIVSRTIWKIIRKRKRNALVRG